MACQTAPAPPTEESGAPPLDCPEGLGWESAAAPLLQSYCTSCHSSQRLDDDRFGAPDGVDFDTVEGALAHAARIQARLESGDMPPQTGVPAHLAQRFADWLACGAPGEAVSWPETTTADRPTEVGAMAVSVSVSAVDPALLDVVRTFDFTDQRLVTERWLVDGDDLWLVERERHDADGTTLYLDQWDPPVAIVVDGAPAGETVTWRLHEEGGVETEEQEVWLATEGDEDLFDGQVVRDPNPTRLLLTSDQGAQVGLQLSAQYGITQAWWDEPGVDPVGDRLSFLQVTTSTEGESAGEGIFAGRNWIEHYYAAESP